jgi:hypothetical protein
MMYVKRIFSRHGIAPPLLALLLPGKGVVGLGWRSKGNRPHLPGPADAPLFPDEAPCAELSGLHVQPVESPHVLDGVVPVQNDCAHARSLEIALCDKGLDLING